MTFNGLSFDDKIKASEKMVCEAYYKNSRIDHLIVVKPIENSIGDFLKIGSRFYIPKDWYTSNNVAYDLALNQLGENVAFLEEKHILSEILKDDRINRIKLREVSSQILKDQLAQMSFCKPTVMFAPVQFYADLLYKWSQVDKDYSMETGRKITIQKKPFEIFWSNHYNPFNGFILLDKSFGEWITKPTLDKRFVAKIEASDKDDQLLLTMQTPFKFTINNPEKVRILEIPQKQKVQVTKQSRQNETK